MFAPVLVHLVQFCVKMSHFEEVKPPFTGPNKDTFLTLWRNGMLAQQQRQSQIVQANGASSYFSNANLTALYQAQQYKKVRIGALQLITICCVGFPYYGKSWKCLKSAR